MSERHFCYDGQRKCCIHAYRNTSDRECCGARVNDYTTGKCEQCKDHNADGECNLFETKLSLWQRVKNILRAGRE